MIELTLAQSDYKSLVEQITGTQTEECAVLFTRQVVRKNGVVRLLVKEVVYPTDSDYTRKGRFEAELSPQFVANITKRAKQQVYGIVFVHSHLGQSAPEFSLTDDLGERRLATFLSHRHPTVTHAALVASKGGICARRLGSDEPISVVALGATRDVIFDPQLGTNISFERFDRQVRAFGKDGQANLLSLRIAIVGLGGTGSLIAQQLAHLGIQNFILIDPDTLEESNLNRVALASPLDVGISKVDLAERHILHVNPLAQVTTSIGDIIRVGAAKLLTEADIIFGCTDSHGSRAILQQIAYQYLIPCIDMGTVIAAKNGKVTHISGRVQLLAPGFACFTCGGLLNSEEVRRDMLSAFERQNDPYIHGYAEPAPAVISINGTVSSLAVTMLLSIVAGIPLIGRHILYNAMQPTLRTIQATPDPHCYICSASGALAEGDMWPIMGRHD